VRTILLQGIVGSTAYGLAHAGSDVDRLGIFAQPATAFHGLRAPVESIVSHEPDLTLHEARKYCLLALAVNPTVTELMWLPSYDIETDLGASLVAVRDAFLSAPRVRDAYLGYASQQLNRLASKDVRDVSPAKVAKHARHLARLAHQGRELYSTGSLRVRLDNPEWYVDFGERVAADVSVARDLLANVESSFDETSSPLPSHPDEPRVEAWLQHVRAVLPGIVEDASKG
jgi:uncharacterized protein